MCFFNLHLGVGHSVLCQMEGLGHMFSIHVFSYLQPLPFPSYMFWPAPFVETLFVLMNKVESMAVS